MKIRNLWSRTAFPPSDGEQPAHLLLRVDLPTARRAAAVDLTLVLDRSGSMEGPKMDHLRGAVRTLVSRLTPADRLAVAYFDDEVERLVPMGPMVDPEGVLRKVAEIPPRGGTQIGEALRAGLQEFQGAVGEGRVHRLVLVTDGRTHGDEEECRNAARAAVRQGVALSCLGIGDDWNEALLLEIAEAGGGHASWIEHPEAIRDELLGELAGVRASRVTGAEMTLRMEGGTVRRVYRTRPMISDLRVAEGREVHAPLGDLEGDPALLVEVALAPHGEGSAPVGKVSLRGEIPGGGIASGESDLEVVFTADPTRCRIVPEVADLVERVGAFRLQTIALREARTGRIDAATLKLRTLSTRLMSLGEAALAEEAAREAQALSKTGAATPRGTKVLEFGTRKLTQRLTVPGTGRAEQGGR